MSPRASRPKRPPGPIRRAWGRFIDRTVWARDSQPEGEKDYHLVAQLDLPVFDVLVGAFAIAGVLHTVPAIEIVWGVYVVHVITFVLAFSILSAMIGLIFRRQALEAWSKVVMVLTFLVYPSAALTLAIGDIGNRQAIVFLLYALAVLPAMRVRYLFTKMYRRRLVKQVVARITSEIPTLRQEPASD